MSNKERDDSAHREVLGYLSQYYGDLSILGEGAGSINETLFIKNGRGVQLVLQRGNLKREPEALCAEHKFIGYLQANGFPAVNALKLNSSPFFVCNGFSYSVYPFVPGMQLDIGNVTQIGVTFESIGQFLSLSIEYDKQRDIWRKRWWNLYTYPFEDNFKTYLEDSPYSLPIRKIYFSSKTGLFDHLIYPAQHGGFKEGIIHSDYRPEHLLFENDKLVGVVDWSSAHHDALVMEFARPLLYICQSSEQREQLLAKVERYIELSPQEIEAAFYSPLLLELVELIWIIKNKRTFDQEEFDRELTTATSRVIDAHRICGEIK